MNQERRNDRSLCIQIAQDLADEDIGVIVAPARSYPEEWGQRRIIPGPPLSNHTLPSYLVSHGVVRPFPMFFNFETD